MKHLWVQIETVPVVLEANSHGGIDVYTEGDHLDHSKKDALVGCWACDTLANVDNIDDECIGSSSEGQSTDAPNEESSS